MLLANNPSEEQPMHEANSSSLIKRLGHHDLAACVFSNRICHYRLVERFFSLISRLGDGVFWYSLMLVLPFIYGLEALSVSALMALIGLAGLACYKWLKAGTTRPRPYTVSQQIRLGTAPLDQFSFPSGHTLHAVGFSLTACHEYPELGWLLIPFTSLIAISRVVLGLHYPSDVLAGASLGAAFALVGLSLL